MEEIKKMTIVVFMFGVLLATFVGIVAKVNFGWEHPSDEVCIIAIWPVGLGLLFCALLLLGIIRITIDEKDSEKAVKEKVVFSIVVSEKTVKDNKK